MTINNVVIGGNITATPEIRMTNNQVPCSRFSIALQGLNNETDFVECICWRQQAEYLTKYVKQGDFVCVEGQIKQEKWQTKDGKNASKIIVYAMRVSSIGRKTSNGTNEPQSQKTEPPKQQIDNQPTFSTLSEDDDIPF